MRVITAFCAITRARRSRTFSSRETLLLISSTRPNYPSRLSTCWRWLSSTNRSRAPSFKDLRHSLHFLPNMSEYSHRGAVLVEECEDPVLHRGPHPDEARPVPHQRMDLPQLPRRNVTLGHQVSPEEMGKDPCINFIRLDPGGSYGSCLEGVREGDGYSSLV